MQQEQCKAGAEGLGRAGQRGAGQGKAEHSQRKQRQRQAERRDRGRAGQRNKQIIITHIIVYSFTSSDHFPLL